MAAWTTEYDSGHIFNRAAQMLNVDTITVNQFWKVFLYHNPWLFYKIRAQVPKLHSDLVPIQKNKNLYSARDFFYIPSTHLVMNPVLNR